MYPPSLIFLCPSGSNCDHFSPSLPLAIDHLRADRLHRQFVHDTIYARGSAGLERTVIHAVFHRDRPANAAVHAEHVYLCTSCEVLFRSSLAAHDHLTGTLEHRRAFTQRCAREGVDSVLSLLESGWVAPVAVEIVGPEVPARPALAAPPPPPLRGPVPPRAAIAAPIPGVVVPAALAPPLRPPPPPRRPPVMLNDNSQHQHVYVNARAQDIAVNLAPAPVPVPPLPPITLRLTLPHTTLIVDIPRSTPTLQQLAALIPEPGDWEAQMRRGAGMRVNYTGKDGGGRRRWVGSDEGVVGWLRGVGADGFVVGVIAG